MTRQRLTYPIDSDWCQRLTSWLDRQEYGMAYAGKGWNHGHHMLAGFGVMRQAERPSIDAVLAFARRQDDVVFAHFNYEVKDQLEDLQSSNESAIGFPLLSCLVPLVVVEVSGSEAHFLFWPEHTDPSSVARWYDEICAMPISAPSIDVGPVLSARIDRETYLKDLQLLQQHIHRGDVYQANYCQEFTTRHPGLDCAATFNQGFAEMPNPFSGFFRLGPHRLMCFSPERFLSFEGNKVRSQPMKGTAPRGATEEEDMAHKERLKHSEKDRRENVMIVDMVRNDLSRHAVPGSVIVPELYKIETYRKVHQMYSTVEATMLPHTHPLEVLLDAFPMGSMTGAPKVRAMQLLESLEHSQRGIYSGTIGYLLPDGRADFNVVIRSLVYHASDGVLSCHAGGGITALSIPEEEYEESLVKATPLLELWQRKGEPGMLTLTDGASPT